MAGSTTSLDTETSSWFKLRYPDAKPKLVVEHPWACTWSFEHEGHTYYLKQIRGGGSQKVLAAMSIARAFEETVPSVAAANPSLAVMAVADHGGKELKSRTENMAKVLPTYARLQCKAMQRPFGSKIVPRLDINTLYDELLSFFEPARSNNITGTVGAEHFLGQQKARRLHMLISKLRTVVHPHLAKASLLPQTINHCDLRPPNLAKKEDGSISIFDWDDATWGPVGLSLHSQFSGCLRPHLALSADMSKKQVAQIQSDRKHLDAYIDFFADAKVIDSDAMRENLSAAIVAGVINYIVGFQFYATKDAKMKKAIGRNITKRLASLLDVAELIAHPDKSKTRTMADAYFRSQQEVRLKRLQKRHKDPLLDIPNLNGNALEDARKPGTFPAITFSDIERDAGVCSSRNAHLAAQIYREQGAVLLGNSLSQSMLEECHSYILQRYDDYFQDNRPKDSLRVGNKRFMITLTLDGPLNQPALYAPPTVMPILERLLSDKMILGSIVAVTSLPGAKNQSRHRDHHALFPDEDTLPPPFATSVMIPLVDMNEEVGATRIFKGSHLRPTDEANKMPPQDPVVPVGSCFLMDYRVQHMGMANKSRDKVRPVITLIFQRPWFRDYVNYDNQERMILPADEFAKISEEHRSLFDWK